MWHVFHHKWWDKGNSSKRNQRLCTDRFFEAMDNGIWWDKKTSMGIYGDISWVYLIGILTNCMMILYIVSVCHGVWENVLSFECVQHISGHMKRDNHDWPVDLVGVPYFRYFQTMPNVAWRICEFLTMKFFFFHHFLVEGRWTPLQGCFTLIFPVTFHMFSNRCCSFQVIHKMKFNRIIISSMHTMWCPPEISWFLSVLLLFHRPFPGKKPLCIGGFFSVAALGLQSHLIIRASSKTWFWMGSVT